MDAKIKAAVYEIDRAQKQIEGATAKQAPKLKRIERMLDGAAEQLKSSDNKQDDTWKTADSQLNALQAQLALLQKPKATEVPDPNQLSPADQNLLGSIDRQTDGLIKQVGEYDKNDVIRLHQRITDDISKLKQQYQRLTNPAHPQAIVVAQKILGIESHVQNTVAKQAAQEESLGDVEAEVAKIEKRIHPSNRTWYGSPVPTAPLHKKSITTYTLQMHEWKEHAARDLAYLTSIDGKSTKVNTTYLIQKVTHEQQQIDQFNTVMAERIESQLASYDEIYSYIENVPSERIDEEMAKMQLGLEVLDATAQFSQLSGQKSKETKKRKQRYTTALATLRKASMSAAVASKNKPKGGSTTAKKKATLVQEIQVYDANKIEIMSDGEIWIDGDKAGDITKDGEIWVAGDKEGDLTKDGEVWKAGDKIGDITKDGEVWRDGDKVGDVNTDGEIWINGSREGWFKGGDGAQAASIVFFGFFNLAHN